MHVYVRKVKVNPLPDCITIVLGKELFMGGHPCPTDTFLVMKACILCYRSRLHVPIFKELFFFCFRVELLSPPNWLPTCYLQQELTTSLQWTSMLHKYRYYISQNTCLGPITAVVFILVCFRQWFIHYRLFTAVIYIPSSVYCSDLYTMFWLMQWAIYHGLVNAVIYIPWSVWCSGLYTMFCLMQWFI